MSRRRLVAGMGVAGAAWIAPSIVRSSVVAAAVGSCITSTVSWTSVTSVGSTYTATGTSGTLTITATVIANLSGGSTPSVFISGGRVVIGMSGHQIGDYYTIALSFSDSSGGVVCTASTLLIDIDQNGQGLGCPTDSRFRDEISAITGPSLVTTLIGSVAEAPAGTFASTANCKSGDVDNLGLAWSDNNGVGGTGFTYTAGTPPGNNSTLDYQLIKIDPMVLCVAAAGGGPGAPVPQGASILPTPIQITESPDQD